MTMGDPAGRRPGAGAGAHGATGRPATRRSSSLPRPAFLAAVAARIGSETPVIETEAARAASVFEAGLPVVPLDSPFKAESGRPDASAAAATIESIRRAVEAVRRGEARAVVTNPIAKAVLYRGRLPLPWAYRISGRARERLGRAGLSGHDDLVARRSPSFR